MFTGIIEDLGVVTSLEKEGTNVHIEIESKLASELKIDQSIAHNGVCLTVVDFPEKDKYVVTAIQETLKKSNLGDLSIGDKVNLERCLRAGDRLDGHMVQGHVDTTAICEDIRDENGSWVFRFSHKNDDHFITVEKGSVCVNGISLTVVDSHSSGFSVAIIPYTYEHTNLHTLKIGDRINVEFDILGKYIAKLNQRNG
ncbi:MAG: riboflavin synthase [Cryomorphaceae bacterium]|nr:riboflavin synthase [Cryomorphaceae bacterium]